MDSHTDVPFAVNIETFRNPWPADPKLPKFAQFWSGQFSLDFAFNIGGLGSKHPLFFIGAQ